LKEFERKFIRDYCGLLWRRSCCDFVVKRRILPTILWTVLLLVAIDVLLFLKTFAIVATVSCTFFFNSPFWNLSFLLSL